MRRSFNSDFLTNDNGEIIGINLGADYCAEHEWGIRGIKRSFKLNDDEKVFGIKKRIINVIPETLVFKEVKIKNKKHYVLVLLRYIDDINEDYKKWLPSDLIPYNKQDLSCAWNENSFGILVTSKYKKEIQLLYNAFLNKDITIGISPSQAFKNGGLIFTIASELPKEIIDSIYEADLDYYNLQTTAKETGIYEVLENAGKRYFALSPRWKDVDKKEVIFWLNPMEQHIHNFGWYTINDLKEWADNKGKIMMVK